MPAPLPGHVGLTRRELERELAWLLKRAPEDPRALLKLFSEALVALINKNNSAISRALAEREGPASGGGPGATREG